MSRFPKKEPWPEELVTSPASQQISQLHNHLDQLKAQADLIAAYMPTYPAILSRPVVTLNSSMIVTTQDDQQALRDLRQDITQKQTDFDAYDQQYDQEYDQKYDRHDNQGFDIADDEDGEEDDKDIPQKEEALADKRPDGQEHTDKPDKPDESDANNIQALIRSYVIRCLEEEAPQLIRDELVALLSAELATPQKPKKQSK